MITIVAKNSVKTECVDVFRKLANELVIESNKEAGCLEYNLYQDESNDTVFTFIEKWSSMNAVDQHNASNHFKKLVGEMKGLLNCPSEVNLYKTV